MADEKPKSTLTATPDQEPELIAVLQSDSSRKEKADACRELSRFGSKAAIAPLASLLKDEELSHMARYALEPNPDPEVDSVFRENLSELKGGPLIGVIGSIGVRRDSQAVPLLVGYLSDPDDGVVQATARSLGRIGTAEAADALLKALSGIPPSNLHSLCEGLLRCADALAEDEKTTEKAREIYDRLRILKAPHEVRTAAFRGAVRVRGEEGVKLVVETLRGDDELLAASAAHVSAEIRSTGMTRALADELKNLSVDRRILVIQTLGDRKDPAAFPALADAARAGDKRVRIEAIRNIPALGGKEAEKFLKELTKDSDSDVAEAAEASLNALE